MKYYTLYNGHDYIVKRKKCENIFTFDIETTSVVKLDDKIYPAIEYDKFTDDEKERAMSLSCMYIWQFGIDDKVYFGRTWNELKDFLITIESENPYKKIIYIHNLSFEFQFLRNIFKFKNVFARKKRHVIRCELEDYNVELRCSLTLSNIRLAKLSSTYHLSVQKLEGDLDYSVIRNSKTRLTARELKYCENDCLVLYEYIKFEKENNKKIPMTFTGHVREKLKDSLDNSYKNKLRKQINIEPIIYNRMVECFAGRIYARKLVLYRESNKKC